MEARREAWQTTIMAALDCGGSGEEFSEWTLAVAAWARDNQTFGMRGYSSRHPDHKRVYTELIGAIKRGYLKKTRRNHFQLTPLGKAAAGLEISKSSKTGTLQVDHYEAIRWYVFHPLLAAWRIDPDTPKEWEAVPDFLGTDHFLNPNSPEHAAAAVRAREAVLAALRWCNNLKTVYIISSYKKDRPIAVKDAADVLPFLQALAYRFSQLAETRV